MKEHLPINENNAIQRLRDICSRSEKSGYEIRKKLKEWGLESKTEAIIKLLEEENFIDDMRYSHAFAHDKIFINKWGKIKVAYLLKMQHIHSNNINEVLKSIDEDEYEKMISSELEKKKLTFKKTPPDQVRFKLYRFGAQRGYEQGILHRIIDSLR
jgi:regulatory protein